jgi:L-rhamnose-H+ transport protein
MILITSAADPDLEVHMGGHAASGFLTILAAGLLQGTVLTPMAYLHKWQWENVWIVYASWAYLTLPWVFAATTVPHLLQVLATAPTAAVLRTIIFGFLWGVAVVLFGLGCEMLGIALGFAIILGLGTSVGTLVPLILQHRDQVFAPAGLGTIAGSALLTVAVILLSIAGKKRDEVLKGSTADAKPAERQTGRGNFVLGLILCIVCGILSPLYNIAFAYGTDIQAKAVHFGAAPTNAGNVVWLLVTNSGYLPSLFYALLLLNRRKTWGYFSAATPRYWVFTAAMGFMWISGTVLYGIGANFMGSLGPVIGWPVLMSTMVLTANFWGLLAGEWKGVHGFPRRLGTAALAVLVVAMFTLGLTSRL